MDAPRVCDCTGRQVVGDFGHPHSRQARNCAMSERILMKFLVGQRVVKEGENSRFEGEVVAAFVKRNMRTLRYVIEDDGGVLHIASERQLRLTLPNAPGAARTASLRGRRRQPSFPVHHIPIGPHHAPYAEADDQNDHGKQDCEPERDVIDGHHVGSISPRASMSVSASYSAAASVPKPNAMTLRTKIAAHEARRRRRGGFAGCAQLPAPLLSNVVRIRASKAAMVEPLSIGRPNACSTR
jgi:hypothetical protein